MSQTQLYGNLLFTLVGPKLSGQLTGLDSEQLKAWTLLRRLSSDSACVAFNLNLLFEFPHFSQI